MQAEKACILGDVNKENEYKCCKIRMNLACRTPHEADWGLSCRTRITANSSAMPGSAIGLPASRDWGFERSISGLGTASDAPR